MKLLLYDSCNYTQNDIIDSLNELGISYQNILYRLKDIHSDDFFASRISKLLQEDSFDAVYSVNYFPILAQICYDFQIPYIAWSYDSPLGISDIEKTLGLPTNHIYFFDRMEYLDFKKKGFDTVHHLPLGINVKRLSLFPYTASDQQKYGADISFVGHIYEPFLSGLLAPLSEYQQGYLLGILEAQFRVYGAYFLESLISDAFLEEANKSYASLGQTTFVDRPSLSTAIAKHIARSERISLINALSTAGEFKLYTDEKSDLFPEIKVCGSVKYYTEMPKVFHFSKINVNPSLRCIRSGIPLRALDVMGSGGFLLSNYQPELAEHFEDGTDLVFYTSMEDALEKTMWYLAHEEERSKIAESGCVKTRQNFSYLDRLRTMFTDCGLF